MDYILLKNVHSIIRWLVLLGALWALIRVWSGFLAKGAWSRQDQTAGLLFTSILNLEFLLGLVLYMLSPIAQSIFKDFGATMREAGLRFFAVEHPLLMLVSVLVAQVGYSISKRARGDRGRFVRATVCYTLATALILIAIPWPFLKYGRPLWP